jgi:hypothetical protein
VSLDDIRNPIDQVLRSVGFRSRAKRLWERPTAQILQVVHLDKSSYGPQNRLEVFFSLTKFVDRHKYKLADLDVKINFGRIVEHSADFKSALDQESVGMAPDVRTQIIQMALRQSLEPLLMTAVDEQGLSKLRETIPSKNDLFIAPRTASVLCSL